MTAQIHTMIRPATGAVYYVKRMRSEASFWLPVYHYRAADGGWLPLQAMGPARTLADARAAVRTQTIYPPWEEPSQPDPFYRS